MVSHAFIILVFVGGIIAVTLFLIFAAPTFKMGLAKMLCGSLVGSITQTTPSLSSSICQIITQGV